MRLLPAQVVGADMKPYDFLAPPASVGLVH